MRLPTVSVVRSAEQFTCNRPSHIFNIDHTITNTHSHIFNLNMSDSDVTRHICEAHATSMVHFPRLAEEATAREQARVQVRLARLEAEHIREAHLARLPIGKMQIMENMARECRECGVYIECVAFRNCGGVDLDPQHYPCTFLPRCEHGNDTAMRISANWKRRMRGVFDSQCR